MRNKEYHTTCSYCGVGCGITIRESKNGDLQLEGTKDHPVNQGMLCSKGMNLLYTVNDTSDRLKHPEMRWSKHHPMERVDWDTALNRAAMVFKSLIAKYGPDAVGFYVSGQCLTEEYYLVNKLTKGFIGTNNIDTNSRLCMSSAVVGYVKTLGEDSVPISYEDIELADLFFIAGANPAWCHPILFRRIEKHKEKNPDTNIIVVDPRVTQTCSLADLHLQINPGTDTVLYQAIGRCLIERGDIDLDFIKKHTDGFDAYRQEVMGRSLTEAAAICDVPLKDIELAATMIGNAKGFLTMWAMGLNQSSEGVNKNLALLGLNLITGHVGKPGSGPFSLTGQPNAMGGREVGGMASLLAAHRLQQSEAHRKEVADYWGVDQLPDKPGLTATQMFEALADGKLKAIWVICTNPSVSLPDARLVDEALKKAKFVIVQDISRNADTVKYADLVLPAAGWLEKEGTMTNSERRISLLRKVIDPPGEALPDAEILIRFARKMGFKGFDYKNSEEIYREHAGLTKGTNIDITGLDYKRLAQEGTFQWPVPSKDHRGTPRLFSDHQFYTKNKRAQIHTCGPQNEAEPLNDDYPLILTTGRIRDQWHTMTRTGKVSKLKKHIDKPFLEIHPSDAAQAQIKDGDPVIIENTRGQVNALAKVTEDIKSGVVFLPMHWGKILNRDFGRANNLTSSNFDPVSKQPGFKYAAVKVQKYIKPKQKVIVVGAGAAAYRFINTYRDLNKVDEIHVFSKEAHPFYNRVLLPEYANDNLAWKDLKKFKKGEIDTLNVNINVSNSIQKINREEKIVVDAFGETHSYDLLVLATGSRAFVPGDVPLHWPGVFTMRNRHNADDLKPYLQAGNHVIVVGGGLLGIELASALKEIKIDVSIVQLSSRLMERQLDTMASGLLREQIEKLGIKVHTNDQVHQLIRESDGSFTARLKSGQDLTCAAVVYAIGTRPNIELGLEAGLECGRGLKVNDYLQSSDDSIFAIGEIAEHRGTLNGITAAAEQQADILAHFLNGALSSSYQGSIPMNILKISDLPLCSLGIAEPPPGKEDEYEEILFIDKKMAYYKKCIVHHDRLVGAVLMGDKTEFAEFKSLIENKTELSDKRLALLRSGEKPEPVIGKLVCSCNNIGQGNLEKVIESGVDDFNQLCTSTGAGLGCGSCKPEVKNILLSKLVATPAD